MNSLVAVASLVVVIATLSGLCIHAWMESFR